MKNLLIIFISIIISIIILWGCTPDSRQKFEFKVLPVESYILPDSLKLGTTQTFKIRYKRPSNCHFFEGFYFEKNFNERTIGVSTSVLQENCQPLSGVSLEVDLKFFTSSNEDYIFRFFKGKDVTGTNIFESVTVPVKN